MPWAAVEFAQGFEDSPMVTGALRPTGAVSAGLPPTTQGWRVSPVRKRGMGQNISRVLEERTRLPAVRCCKADCLRRWPAGPSRRGRTDDRSRGDLYDAITEGAVERVRPKMMRVVAITAGCCRSCGAPAQVENGIGADTAYLTATNLHGQPTTALTCTTYFSIFVAFIVG